MKSARCCRRERQRGARGAAGAAGAPEGQQEQLAHRKVHRFSKVEDQRPALLAADVHFLVVGHLEVCAAGQQLQQRLHEHQHEEEHEEKERQQQQQQQDVHVVYRCSSCTQVSFEPAAWP